MSIYSRAAAEWVLDSITERESPRCPKYPDCCGEDGTGILEQSEHRFALTDISMLFGPGSLAKRKAYSDPLVADAPRCKECSKYAAANEKLLEQLRKMT